MHDHRNAATRNLCEHGFCVGVEQRSVIILEWMQDNGTGLMVKDTDDIRILSATIVRPLNVACENVLGSL
jgi:hypothetical protein